MKSLFLLLALITASTSHLEWQQNPVLFFQHFAHLGQTFDPSVANLYGDSAVVRSFRRYPHGLERQMETSGANWKTLIRRVMPIAKQRGDKSNFSDVSITENESGITIRAKRFSVLKCYTDPNYYMRLSRTQSGDLKIVEEYMETQAQSNC